MKRVEEIFEKKFVIRTVKLGLSTTMDRCQLFMSSQEGLLSKTKTFEMLHSKLPSKMNKC